MKKLDMTPLKSSMFAAHHYDPTTSKLTVEFKNGDTWQYDDVPADKAETFSGSASPGSFFGARIRGIHAGRKL